MAKKGKTTSPARLSRSGKTGAPKLPVCIALVACEQVIVGNDNVTSAIRIVDTITMPAGFVVPEGASGVEFPNVRLLAIVKKGESKARFDFELVCVEPNGNRVPIGRSKEVNIEGGPEAGSNINIPLRLSGAKDGLYWIELLADKSLIGRTPVRVKPDTSQTGESSDNPSVK